MATEKRLIDAKAGKKLFCAIAKPAEYNGVIHLVVPIGEIDKLPTVDAVEVADMKEFAEDVAYQFGYYCQNGGRLHITHGGLSTLKWAFNILGWDNPHPVPECECQIDGCHYRNHQRRILLNRDRLSQIILRRKTL